MIPLYITSEQIAVWDEKLRQDELLLNIFPLEIINLPEFKEVLYAGLWLVEKMVMMDHGAETIRQAQQAHGEHSFGKDTWLIAKIFVDAYQASAPRKNN